MAQLCVSEQCSRVTPVESERERERERERESKDYSVAGLHASINVQ